MMILSFFTRKVGLLCADVPLLSLIPILVGNTMVIMATNLISFDSTLERNNYAIM